MKKLIFYSFIALNLITPSIRSSNDEIDKFLGSLATQGEEFVAREAAREKRKRHNKAVRILKKAKRKYSADFECIERRAFDGSRKDCLASGASLQQSDHAHHFKKIKNLRDKVEDAEFSLDANEKIDSPLNAKEIIKQMQTLQAEFIRLFKQEIRDARRKSENDKSKRTQK